MAQYTAARNRTREKIERCFWALYTDKNFRRRVRVSDITQRAGIHRSTFYMYFDSVDEIFDKIKERQIALLEEVCALTASGETSYTDFLAALQALFQENRLFLKPLLAEYHSSSFSLAYRQTLKENLWKDAGFPPYAPDTKEYAVLDMILSGFIEMLIVSLDAGLVPLEENFRIAHGMMELGVKVVLEREYQMLSENG